MDVDAYLERIGYRGARQPTPETLAGLHVAHLLTVPFENLDIRLGRPVVLEPSALFAKLVEHRRGGFCYELNGLFCDLLRALGFTVDRLSGRVWDGGGPGPEFDHMLLRVHGKPDRIADVGFGDSFREPPVFAAGEWAEGDRRYRLERNGDDWLLSQRDPGADWAPQVSFSAVPRSLDEFGPMCIHHQTSPDSSFVRRCVTTLATAAGRTTLSDGRLVVTVAGSRTIRPIEDPAELGPLLRDHFGIDLGPDAELDRLLPPFEAPAAG